MLWVILVFLVALLFMTGGILRYMGGRYDRLEHDHAVQKGTLGTVHNIAFGTQRAVEGLGQSVDLLLEEVAALKALVAEIDVDDDDDDDDDD